MKSTIWATFMVKSPFRTMIESWNLNLDSWQTIDGSTPILDMFLMTKSLYWTTFYGKSPFCTSFADELLSLRWPHQLPGSPPDHRNGNGAEHLCGHWRWPLQRWPGYSPYWDDLEIWRPLWERLGEIQNTGNIWESRNTRWSNDGDALDALDALELIRCKSQKEWWFKLHNQNTVISSRLPHDSIGTFVGTLHKYIGHTILLPWNLRLPGLHVHTYV